MGNLSAALTDEIRKMYQMEGVQQKYVYKSQDNTGCGKQGEGTAGQIARYQLQTLGASR